MKTSTPLVVAAAAVVVAYTAGHLAGAGDRARLGAALAAARRQVGVDRLTGLGNRAGLDVELARRAGRGESYALLLADLDAFKPVNDTYGHAAGDAVLVEVARRAGRGESYALLLADLDAFKPVNDTYGHAAGDAVLVEVARRLAGLTPAGGLAARLGGDEFVLLAPAATAGRVARDVVRVVAQPMRVGGRQISVGLAYATVGMAASEVLHAADVAMYRAKTAGGAGVAEYDQAAGLSPVAPRARVRLRQLVHAGVA